MKPGKHISERLRKDVIARLETELHLRKRLPGKGRLFIDRPLPFLCVYVRPKDIDDKGTARLIMGEAAHLILPSDPALQNEILSLIKTIVSLFSKEFGAFLILELWSGTDENILANEHNPFIAPSFHIYAPKDSSLKSTVATLKEELQKIRIQKRESKVEVHYNRKKIIPAHFPLLCGRTARSLNCYALGVAVSPIYRSADGEILYPLILRQLRRGMSRAMKRTFHQFSTRMTSHSPPSYLALGRRAMVKAIWDVDKALAEISDSFDFLWQVSPVNIEAAWRRFKRRKFVEAPQFEYRPLPIDPAMMKRKLFRIPIERLEDPTLEHLFREKQMNLDRELTMLMDVGTRRFLYGSLQIYGTIKGKTLAAAHDLLEAFPSRYRDDFRQGHLDAKSFAVKASEEINYYRDLYPPFSARVEIRDDMYPGLMVSRGTLLVGSQSRIPVSRAEALLHHEVGTHLVTYFNGRAQPFKQLYVGLAGYDELQEGLGVLAEYLVDGLSRSRLRLLAARVLAVQGLLDGAGFIDVFRLLNRTYHFEQRSAFTITTRIFRGGGLTKDAIYLRGLLKIMHHLQNGNDITPLYIGKIATHHVPLMRELMYREVLQPAPLRPRFLDCESVQNRLRLIQTGEPFIESIITGLKRRRHT